MILPAYEFPPKTTGDLFQLLISKLNLHSFSIVLKSGLD
ncbi:hypothetical protein LBBP_00259 [Leptospira borgpetersenii serovar Ballum]|uniref:Uncharacterized protein n=1 Tax=Leptospira borgpetersenii serovar Ballum TaxID=280505 RepID=A0A0S2ILS9_LEPBO|nr:hypothetical protein LBBP_00259 [Leptospira borgpetersenii serovar Ballum]